MTEACAHGIHNQSLCSACAAECRAELQRWKEKCWQLEADMACRHELCSTIAKLTTERDTARRERDEAVRIAEGLLVRLEVPTYPWTAQQVGEWRARLAKLRSGA